MPEFFRETVAVSRTARDGIGHAAAGNDDNVAWIDVFVSRYCRDSAMIALYIFRAFAISDLRAV